jgi:hypothetical protein
LAATSELLGGLRNEKNYQHKLGLWELGHGRQSAEAEALAIAYLLQYVAGQATLRVGHADASNKSRPIKGQPSTSPSFKACAIIFVCVEIEGDTEPLVQAPPPTDPEVNHWRLNQTPKSSSTMS